MDTDIDNKADEAVANSDMTDLPISGMNNYSVDNMCNDIADEHVTITAHEQQT